MREETRVGSGDGAGCLLLYMIALKQKRHSFGERERQRDRGGKIFRFIYFYSRVRSSCPLASSVFFSLGMLYPSAADMFSFAEVKRKIKVKGVHIFIIINLILDTSLYEMVLRIN